MGDIYVEDENILTSIFKDSFPESWQDNPDFLNYLAELSSYGVERLAREPDRLVEEKSQILAETQDLAFHNYTTFIETSDCSKEIFQDFQIIERNLDSLLSKLPSFSEECGNVIKKAQEISSSRRMNTLTLQRHTQLLEILEMPQLMDTCVRNHYYEEALELAVYVKRLEKKHPSIPVILDIVQEVKASTQLMLNQLVQQLRTNLQLPACLRIIGFLRRMDVFTEAELRIKFLQARDSWFQSILEAIPKDDVYSHITKTIEVSRVHLFDIMTQFRAIFSDEDPLVSTGREQSVNEAMLFQSWVLQKISQFLSILERDLAQGVGGRLDSIIGQCMYFGLSFSRVGADFRGLLAPIFERATLTYFKQALAEANKKFEDNMQACNLLGVSTTGGLHLGMGSSQSGQLYPPTSLLDFYPLASLCNHILTAFNDLRLCAPLNVACLVAAELHTCLMEANRVILAFHRAEETTFNAKEKDAFEQLCASYATDLLPYINTCLQTLYPPGQLAPALGLTLTEMAKQTRIGLIDLNTVLANIAHLMPKPPPQQPPQPPPQPEVVASPPPLSPHHQQVTNTATTTSADIDPDDTNDPDETNLSLTTASHGRSHKVSFTLASDEDEEEEEESPQPDGGVNASMPPMSTPDHDDHKGGSEGPPPVGVVTETTSPTTDTTSSSPPPSSLLVLPGEGDGGKKREEEEEDDSGLAATNDLVDSASGQGDWNDPGFDLDNFNADSADTSEENTIDLDALP